MMANENQIIVVLGATGQQGRGVVEALKSKTAYRVRAITRNPENYQGEADEVVAANLNEVDSLVKAFDGAYGVFVVTNFWEQGTDEISQAKNAITAAKAAGIKHFIWSTLPNVEEISGGKFHVPHFTDKAKVDELVAEANFQHHTFVVASFFYQNLTTNMAPQRMQDGTIGWALPISAKSKAIHMADISELGAAVAGAFLHPEKTGTGQYLPVVGDLMSFEEIISTLAAQGKTVTYQEVPADVFATFFPGADELGQMFAYFQSHTYMGNVLGDAHFELERDVAGRVPTSFADWAAKNWQ